MESHSLIWVAFFVFKKYFKKSKQKFCRLKLSYIFVEIKVK